MPINFIPIQTDGQDQIDVALVSSDWENGDPLISISGSIVKKDMVVQSLLHPTNMNLDPSQLVDIFDDMYFQGENDYVEASGCFHTYFRADLEDVPFKTQFKTRMKPRFGHKPISRIGENTKYNYSYIIRYKSADPTFEDVYTPVLQTPLSGIISKAIYPDKDFFWMQASGVLQVNSSGVVTTDLYLNINHSPEPYGYELQNVTEGGGYELYIEDGLNDYSYDIHGNKYDIGAPVPVDNFYTTPNILLTLPYASTKSDGTEIKQDYTIKLRYKDQAGDYTKYIIFNTKNLSETDTDLQTGENLDKLANTKWLFHSPIVVDSTISHKYRLSLDIFDMKNVSNKYEKSGTYYSKYYTMDSPIYSVFILTKDSFPKGIGVDSIKYFIKFGEQEKIQISPSNRDTESIIENGTETIIPKVMIIDKIENTEANTLIKQITAEESIYSFQIIIEFDVNEYVNNEFFIPPSIDSYECHVTDRTSFLRI